MSQKDIYKEKYLELEIIGRGNFGQAVIVRDQQTNKLAIAKKILLINLGQKEQKSTLNESSILQSLDHPNIVQYYDSFSFDDQLIIIMEYCEESDLSYHIKKKREKKEQFPEIVILNWFVQIALALDYIHTKKILHRDIKTQNIFLTSNGTVKLGDFGISKILEHTTDIASTVVGTPYQMSPEVCESQPYSYKSDVWALGCVLYELCTLKVCFAFFALNYLFIIKHAFDSNNLLGLVHKIVQSKQEPIDSMYSSDLQNLVNTMLAKNASERPYIKQILQNPFVQKAMQEFVDTKGQQQLKEQIQIKPRLIHNEATQQSIKDSTNFDLGKTLETQNYGTCLSKQAPDKEQTTFDLGKTLETKNYGTCFSTMKAQEKQIQETPKERMMRLKEEKIQRDIEEKKQAAKQYYIDKSQTYTRKSQNYYGEQQLDQHYNQYQYLSATQQYQKKVQEQNYKMAQTKAFKASNQSKNIIEIDNQSKQLEQTDVIFFYSLLNVKQFHTAFEQLPAGSQFNQTYFEDIPIQQLKQIQNKQTGKFDFQQLQQKQEEENEIFEDIPDYDSEQEQEFNSQPLPRLTKMATSQQMQDVVAVYKQQLNKTTSYSKESNTSLSPTKQQQSPTQKIPTKAEKINNRKQNCINILGEQKFKQLYSLLKNHRRSGKEDDQALNQKIIDIVGKQQKMVALQIDEIIFMETI